MYYKAERKPENQGFLTALIVTTQPHLDSTIYYLALNQFLSYCFRFRFLFGLCPVSSS